jgi:hypothetical protein
MKQYSSIVLFMLVAISGHALGAPLDGSNGDCPGGLANGAQIERGRSVFECRNGNVVAKACVADDLKHIDIGSTSDKKAFRLRCTVNSDGSATLEPTACLHQGQEHKVDEQWEDSTNFYTCKKSETELKVITAGCIDQGKRVPLNQQAAHDDFVYVCNGTVNNGARMMPSGCVKDGKQYNVGDSFEAGNLWFNCTRTGSEKVAAKAAGCVTNGKRVNDGDRYSDNEVIQECDISGQPRLIGCAQRDDKGEIVERRVGCTWVEGPEPFQYEWTCRQESNSAKKVQVRCNYKVGGGVYNIEPGCYRVIDKSAFGCLNNAGTLKLQSFQGDNAEQSAQGAGLHAC